MKSTLLVFAVLSSATVLFAGVPDSAPPPPPKSPAIEEPSPLTREKAETAIRGSVLDIFHRSLRADFSLNFTATAPGEITVNADRLPFEIRGISWANAVAGYYDVQAQSVKLYEPVTKTYVAAAEHSAVKDPFVIVKPAPAPANPAEPVLPPVVQKPSPGLQTKAYTAVNAEVVEVLVNYYERYDKNGNYFDRSEEAVFAHKYTINFTDSAPADIASTPTRQPFKVNIVYSSSGRVDRVVPAYSGYYDATTKSVYLYHKDAYVLAANHPIIKARAAWGRK